jgi:hypothetical protein
MEYVPTREFLRCHVWAVSHGCRRSRRNSLIARGRVREYHIFTTNNASVITHCGQFFLSSIWITLVHISCGGAVSHEVAETGDEGPSGHVHVANHIQGYAVKCDDNGEETKVSGELEKIFFINSESMSA